MQYPKPMLFIKHASSGYGFFLPTKKTENPRNTGSNFSPRILANRCAPTPSEPANNVAIALFTPLPSVAPAK